MEAISILDELNEKRKSTPLRNDNFDIRRKNVYKKFDELVEEAKELEEDSDVGKIYNVIQIMEAELLIDKNIIFLH